MKATTGPAPRGRIALLFTALLVAGCSDSTSPPRPAQVEITASRAVFEALQDTLRLVAVVTSDRGDPMPEARVIWSSGNTGSVVVDTLGVARAVGPGTAVITAASPPASGMLELTVEQRPTGLQVVSGAGQEGEVGRPLAQPITFRLTDPGGSPIAGTAIEFEVTSGGGSIPLTEIETVTGGLAAMVWTLGTDAAAPQELAARAGEVEERVSAVARPGPPATAVGVAGEGQVGLAGEPLADSLAVLVRDAFANPVPDAEVAWIPLEGEGEFLPPVTTTGGEGVARTSWLPGVGANVGVAQVEGVDPFPFQAEGLPNGVIEGTVQLEGAFLSPPGSPPGPGIAHGPPPANAFPGPLLPGAAGAAGGRTGGSLGGPVRAFDGSPDGARGGGGATGPAGADGAIPRQWVVRVREESMAIPLPAGATVSTSAAVAVAQDLQGVLASTAPAADARMRVEGVSPVLGMARISIPPEEDESAVVEALRGDPRIDSVHPVVRVWSDVRDWTPPGAAGIASFTDGLFYPRQSWHYGMIRVPRAWEVTEGTTDVLVAVVDDGIRFDHPSVAPNLTADGYDFVSEFTESFPICGGGTVSNVGYGGAPHPDRTDPTIPESFSWVPSLQCFRRNDSGGHGLHVAGTVAASASGVVGVAPGVRIRPVRVIGTTGSGSSYDVAQGILYAAGLPADDGNGGVVQAPTPARIINLSLGGPQPSPDLQAATEAAIQAGALLIASAGNGAASTPNYPASFPGVVSVGAVGPGFQRATYSNFGEGVTLAGPGGDIQLYGFFGGGVWSSFWHFTDGDPLIAALDGTSMAAPHVSGVAALLLSLDPGTSAPQLRDGLVGTVSALGDPQLGAGLVDALLAVTGGVGFPSSLRVLLLDEATGGVVAEKEAGPASDFRFGGLEDGSYLVYAGGDDRGDGVTGRPGFAWGARGGSALPTPVVIEGHGVRDGDLTIGLPIEAEPNGTPAEANILPVGGYLYGVISPPGDEDHFDVAVPVSGAYHFETSGVHGECGFGFEVDTILDLFDAEGGLVATNDDIDAGAERFCSRIAIELDPGVYTLRVRGWGASTGTYAVRAY